MAEDSDVVEINAVGMTDTVGALRDHLEAVNAAPAFEVPDLNSDSGTDVLFTAAALVAGMPAAIATQFETIARTVLATTVLAVRADAARMCAPESNVYWNGPAPE